ncbi:MAG: hypothetical protein C0485_17065 [Pirellula sp.]|nr:hypothetical protein [Pirellula sp.]
MSKRVRRRLTRRGTDGEGKSRQRSAVSIQPITESEYFDVFSPYSEYSVARSSIVCRVTPAIVLSLCLFVSRVVAGTLGAPQPIEPGHLNGILPNGSFAKPASGVDFTSQQPHPAVARIVVPEGEATSYGSGTLVDVRGDYGLVVTNWHVVRDGAGEVEVIFPDGFRSKARPLKVDADWDLAALVIWRPPAAAVKLAATAPQPGEQLTICGYGSGNYRAATGRCTQYFAPKVELPQHLVELDVEARQGDSGGPIFNSRGELAGVLFGASEGTTLGSFGGRVENFLASLAPNIGSGTHGSAAIAHADAPQSALEADNINRGVSAMLVGASAARHGEFAAGDEPPHGEASPADLRATTEPIYNKWRSVDQTGVVTEAAAKPAETNVAIVASAPTSMSSTPNDFSWLESGKNILALIGAATLMVQLLRLIR